MDLTPRILEGTHVRLEPLSLSHEASLNAAAADGELWNSKVTTVPTPATMRGYIEMTLQARARGSELPFAIVRRSTDDVVGSTRFYNIDHANRRVDIGYTWLAASAQRTFVNTEAKLLLLAHAFEGWHCIRVGLWTHVLNQQSRTAILRLGAKQEGILRQHMILPDGSYRDSVCFSILDAEWPDVKAGLQDKLNRTKR
jgi:RimJ/RimL family protein N-acetyltransferase